MSDTRNPQPSGEALAGRDKAGRSQRVTSSSGQAPRDDGQAGRVFSSDPQRGSTTIRETEAE